MTDWADQRGVATEPDIDRFIASVGGERVDGLFPNATFQNADYVFKAPKVIVELKILETEFGATREFVEKETALHRELAQRFGLGPILRGETEPAKFYARAKRALYRAPLGRITKKANRQLRETRQAFGSEDFLGVLWLVNDNFRQIGSDLALDLLGSTLVGQNSNVRALIYTTNHYVDMPGSDLANLLWVPLYAEDAPDHLREWVNWLGSKWGDFCEQELGPFDKRTKGPDISLAATRPIV